MLIEVFANIYFTFTHNANNLIVSHRDKNVATSWEVISVIFVILFRVISIRMEVEQYTAEYYNSRAEHKE